MKSILMLLLLAMLSTPVLAKSNTNTSECLQMYRTYMKDYGASKFIPPEQMFTFMNQCLPDDYLNKPVRKDNMHSKELLQNNDNSDIVLTIKT